MTDAAQLIDRLEAITNTIRSGAAMVKQVRHDANGRINQIIESPLTIATLAAEAEQISGRLTNQQLHGEQALRAVRAQVRCALAIEPYVDASSRARIAELVKSTERDWSGVTLR